MACEDYPCCGHELGCCPDFDESGRQLNMVCVCGAKLPVDNRSSCCDSCLNAHDDDWYNHDDWEDDDRDDDYDDSMDGDWDSGMASAGFGTDEDYGHYGDDYGDDF